MAQVEGTCLAISRPSVQTPVLTDREREREKWNSQVLTVNREAGGVVRIILQSQLPVCVMDEDT
jgi:hypothetical protein